MASISNTKSGKNILENSFVGSLVVPIAIVLVGALIIFGVTQMLSTGKTYKDLVYDLQSKTFGNRWIAAYELSKQIASQNIPESERPWLALKLEEIYRSSNDHRTKEFLIVTLGTLAQTTSLEIFKNGLNEKEGNVKFHSLVAISNMPKGTQFDWTILNNLLEDSDQGIQQLAIFAIGRHGNRDQISKIVPFLESKKRFLKYSAATSLIEHKFQKAIPVLKEILLLDSAPQVQSEFNQEKVYALKMNVLSALKKARWNDINDVIEKISNDDKNVKVVSMARDVLKELKN
ncbi:MAG: HEAT repeat domain-containing protein [Halobacteriovoraceae bacterium]|nr:HEAT repeat domain-containing protein [Halobacteriovoraceae bacterium]